MPTGKGPEAQVEAFSLSKCSVIVIEPLDPKLHSALKVTVETAARFPVTIGSSVEKITPGVAYIPEACTKANIKEAKAKSLIGLDSLGIRFWWYAIKVKLLYHRSISLYTNYSLNYTNYA